jgi:hypothetical protein
MCFATAVVGHLVAHFHHRTLAVIFDQAVGVCGCAIAERLLKMTAFLIQENENLEYTLLIFSRLLTYGFKHYSKICLRKGIVNLRWAANEAVSNLSNMSHKAGKSLS